jgi:hypothetical protein
MLVVCTSSAPVRKPRGKFKHKWHNRAFATKPPSANLGRRPSAPSAAIHVATMVTMVAT